MTKATLITIALGLCVIAAASPCLNAADLGAIYRVKQLLVKIENDIPPDGRFPEAIIDGGGLEGKPAFKELQADVQSNSQNLMADLDSVAPTESRKVILFLAFQALPAKGYLQFLDRAADLTLTGDIDKLYFRWALFPMAKNSRGVLEDNYDQPLARSILTKAETIYADDPSMLQFCKDVSLGRWKSIFAAYYIDTPEVRTLLADLIVVVIGAGVYILFRRRAAQKR